MPVSALQLQDAQSFSQFYENNHVTIFRFIYGLHGGPVEEVEDLTCDAFMRAWKARSKFTGDEHDALCWLFTIARHLVIDSHRHEHSHPESQPESLDNLIMDEIIPLNQGSPEEEYTHKERVEKTLSLVQALPLEKREMLVLRYILGWQVKEIAQYLAREENTVSVYIRRSLAQIRENWLTKEEVYE